MAAALAQRRWSAAKFKVPDFRAFGRTRRGYEAAAAMHSRGIDISDHKTTSIGDVDIHSFDYIVAMDGAVPHVLHAKGVTPLR